jgi:outer membrane protein insertion porin family
MKKVISYFFVFLLFQFFLSGENIEKIVIKGNSKVSKDTILFYMKSKENGVYSNEFIKKDFRSLWDTGFFENIKIESENGKTGKIITITIKENLMISSITYKTGKKIKEKDITEKLQENNIVLTTFSHYNPSKIKKIEKIIKDILLEKGYNEGKVNIITKKEKENILLTINVIQGPKTRIGSVIFPGLDPKLVSPGFVRRGMKSNKQHGILSTIGNKDVYNKEKMPEDLEKIKLRLQQKGFLEAKVGKPTFSIFNRYSVWNYLWPFTKKRKMLKVSIPVELGPKYKIGEIKIEGNKIIRTDFLKGMASSKMKKGKTYNIKVRDKIIENIRKFYGSLGYFYCQIAPVENLDPIKNIADLTLRIIENEVVYLGKLEFEGNTYTKDHVIRREWFLREGNVLNSNLLEDCIRRTKQLGLVTIEEMPEIKPDPQDPQKINITAKVKEINRQSINFNVGYSGYDGWFISAGYSTQNFLGQGETLSLNFLKGSRAETYSFGFTEPYILNLPASLGINVFKTSYNYPYLYTRNSAGFHIMSSYRFWRFWGSSLRYTLEKVEIDNIDEDLQWENPFSFYYYTEGKRTISSLSPTLYYSTVDSPIFPSSGVKYLFNYRYSGGFLGGDIYLNKFKLEFIKFIPSIKNHTFGIHAVWQQVKSFGGKELPFYERYFLGGEQSIRGFDIYRIGPKNEDGYIIGGDKAAFLNLEYRIPLNQQFSFVLFYDIGNSYDVGVPINIDDTYSSLGVEFRVFVPMLNVPFRLIFAYNPRPLHEEDSHYQFRFAVGPSFY